MSCNVFAIAVTPSHIDFTNYDQAKLVVFNTEDYVKDFSLAVGSGCSVDKDSLRIPPRSSSSVNLSCSCRDCAARLYVRELSNSPGIRVEPAVVVRLSSGNPDDEVDDYFVEPEITSYSFLDLKKPEIIAFVIVFSLLLAFSASFFFRKFYKKKLLKIFKSRKRK